MDIQIITHVVQYGVRRDVLLIQELLESHGHNVQWTIAKANCPDRFDLNIFIECFGDLAHWQFYRNKATKNVLIPNLEWFCPEWLPLLSQLDAIICKTQLAVDTFRRLTSTALYYTSFTSQNRYQHDTPRIHEILHTAGRSFTKGTEVVVGLWEEAGETLPPLQVHFHPAFVAQKRVDLFSFPNLTKNAETLDDETLRFEQNRHQFHLCPSLAEGFGHYINEAKSVGAVVLTTDGPPMSELVNERFGLLVSPKKRRRMRLCPTCELDCKQLQKAVRKKLLPLLKTPDRITEMSILARDDFWRNDLFFRCRFMEAIDRIC